MRKIHLNFETIGSICAIITSVVALFVAVQQTNVMQQQNQMIQQQNKMIQQQNDASVWPIITTEITIKQNEQHSFVRFAMANVGVGPAIVRNGNLFINDHVVTSYQDFQDLLLVGTLKEAVSAETSSLNGVIGARNTKMIMQLSWERNPENDESFDKMVEKFVEQGANLRMSQCYCSVFERCYQTGLGKREGPQEVDSCENQEIDPITRILESVNAD